MQNPEANKQILEVLRLVDTPTAIIAVARIEELEGQLREAQEAAQAQSEAVQRDWLSPAEAEGLRRRNLKLEQQLEAAAQLAHTDERWLNKYVRRVRESDHIAERAEGLLADAVEALQTERQARQEAEKALAIACRALGRARSLQWDGRLRLEAERQGRREDEGLRQQLEVERHARAVMIERAARHISDQLPRKQEAQE